MKKLRTAVFQFITISHCVITQKSAVLKDMYCEIC